MIFLAGRCSFHGLVVVAYVTSQTEGLRLNGLMASYNNYSTCDGILREDTCAFSPPPNVDCSQLNANSKAHHAGMRGLPIWFALPDIGRFSETKSIKCEDKSSLFSPMVPGNKSTYVYNSELSYQLQYAQSYYGLTKRKSGWDCLRHYEILGSGAVPYFEGIEKLLATPKVMYAFPKKLVSEAMMLGKGKNISNIDKQAYCNIRDKLVEYTKTNLTTSALAGYVVRHLKAIGVDEPRILFVSTDGVEYQSGFLYHGLFQMFGFSMSSWAGRKRVLFADHGHDGMAYGRGFSYQGTLPTPSLYQQCGEQKADKLLQEQMHHRLKAGYFNTIIVTNSGNRGCNLAKDYRARDTLVTYLERFPNTAVASVDGNDLCGCHTSFSDQLPHVDLFFMREADDNNPCTKRHAPLVQLPEHSPRLSVRKSQGVATSFTQDDKAYFSSAHFRNQ